MLSLISENASDFRGGEVKENWYISTATSFSGQSCFATTFPQVDPWPVESMFLFLKEAMCQAEIHADSFW